MRIPISELEIVFSRSSGPGGQNVNKVSSRVQIKWNLSKSRYFTPAEKDRIRERLKNRLTQGGEIIVSAAEERSQQKNRDLAIKRLDNLVQGALKIPKKRFQTKPTFVSKLKRLDNKKRKSWLKKLRKSLEL